MKNRLCLFVFLLLASCGKEEMDDVIEMNPEVVIQECIESDYEEEFTLAFGENVCFPNSNIIKFKDAKHHLCPCQIECDYEGDILIELYTVSSEGIAVTNDDKSFYLKNVFNDSEVLYFYTITSFSYTYGADDEDIPACAEDFEKEKMNITMTVKRK